MSSLPPSVLKSNEPGTRGSLLLGEYYFDELPHALRYSLGLKLDTKPKSMPVKLWLGATLATEFTACRGSWPAFWLKDKCRLPQRCFYDYQRLGQGKTRHGICVSWEHCVTKHALPREPVQCLGRQQTILLIRLFSEPSTADWVLHSIKINTSTRNLLYSIL